jgi:hypothetical protein
MGAEEYIEDAAIVRSSCGVMKREERRTQVGWGNLESERILDYLSMGRTMLLPEVDKVDGCG